MKFWFYSKLPRSRSRGSGGDLNNLGPPTAEKPLRPVRNNRSIGLTSSSLPRPGNLSHVVLEFFCCTIFNNDSCTQLNFIHRFF